MNNAQVSEFIDESRLKIEDGELIYGRHIDEILKYRDEISSENAFDIAIQIFKQIIEAFEKEKNTYCVLLIISLEASDTLETKYSIPENARILTNEEPPSIYITTEKYFSFYEKMEVFRKSINPELFELKEVISIEYVCQRKEEAIENDWEYSRFLEFRYLPSASM